ncbi:MAG: glycosyltransferase family 2 protein [Elusimicrobia bacterium]|nr:glycosyltransferase family 2 protein [Elusimicrobiota bacterium]
MTGPLVSVIVPTRDRAPVLKRTIDSVLAQTYPRLELLVVDDGSKDDTERVAAAAGDPRVRYLRNPGAHGASAARNVGIAQARGELIAFNDAGDEWIREKLALQLEAFEKHPRAGLVYSSMIRVRLDGRRSPHPASVIRAGDADAYRRALALDLRVGTPTALVRASVLKDVGGFDERLRGQEDLELFMRVASRAPVHHLETPLALFYDDSRSVSRAYGDLLNAHRRILLKHRVAVGRDGGILAAHFRAIGKLLLIVGRSRDGRRMLCRAAALSRARPSDAGWWAASFLGAAAIGAMRGAKDRLGGATG